MSTSAELSLKTSIRAWVKTLLSVQDPDRTPDAGLMNEWQTYARPEDSKQLASTSIQPAVVIAAIDLGFQPRDADPPTLDVIAAMANKHLIVSVDRKTAHALWRAGIQFEKPRDCQIIADALRLERMHGMDLGDAVFLLRRRHSFEAITHAIEEHGNVEASTMHDMLRFGPESISSEWERLAVGRKVRLQLQLAGISPTRYKSWSRLTTPNLASILDAEHLWSPPEADDWMRALGLSYSDAVDWFETLGDIRLAQTWKSLGYAPTEVSEILLHRIDSSEARQWLELGVFGLERLLIHRRFWSPDDLALWSSWPPDEALDWGKVFSEPLLASTWCSTRLPLDIAKQCFQIGWNPDALRGEAVYEVIEALRFANGSVSFELALELSTLWGDPALRDRWIHSITNDLTIAAMNDWFRSGLSLPMVIAAIELELETDETLAFVEIGVNTIERLQRLVPLWKSPTALAEWTDANFSADEASEWRTAGLSLEASMGWQAGGELVSNARCLEMYGCTPEVWAEYANLGVDPEMAIAMVLAEFEPTTFCVWRNELSGLSVVDVISWFGVGGSLEDVRRWRGRGLSPTQAAHSKRTDPALRGNGGLL